jgi:hexosaminidase
MDNICRHGLLGLIILLAAIFQQAGAQNRIPVVPYPQEVILGKGPFSPSGSSMSLRISGLEGNTVQIIEEQLSTTFSDRGDIEIQVGDDKSPDIWVGIPSADNSLLELVRKKGIEPGSELGEEGYILKIEKKNIYIVANSTAGAFYGVQSLKQLLRGYPEPSQLPVLTIHDWPSIEFRCVMDDISRGPVPTNEYLKQQVRRYAEMKINNMSFYIEHVVKTEKYPDLAPSNGGISIEEFRELSEYAADYHIELVGNFQSLGHFEKILSLPQFRHLGATERMIDPLNPASLDFLEDIYSEMAPAFSSPYFTPNCDEAWDLSRGALKGAAAKLGPARIYADHVIRIDSVLRKLGKRTIIWGDIVLEHPEILEMLPDHMVMGAWDYSPSESFAEFIDPLTEAGFDFTIAPGVLNSNRLIPDYRMTTTNIRNFINEGYEKGTLGVYFTVWDDGGMHFFSHDWYGVAYNAEQCWRPNRDPLEDFDIRFSRGIYGDPKNLIPSSLHALNHLTELEPTFEMNSNVFLKTLVPERGDKITFNPGAWTEVKEWTSEAKKILTAGYTPYYDLDLAYIKFTISQYDFMADARDKLLKASDAYNQACKQQRYNQPVARESLKEAYDIIGDLKYRFERIRADFEIFWDLESREYWKDRALLEYDKHLIAFVDQWNLVGEAMNQYREGNYLPPPGEVRLDIRRQGGQFFQYWLLTGSFHISSFEEYAPDFLTPMGGEADARPFPGMTFTDETDKERIWIKYDSPKLVELDFTTIFEPHITAVAYAYCTIDSPDKRQVTALLGSNDGATVFCNGTEVHHVHAKRSLIPDEDQMQLNLEAGQNHILIKVEQWKAGWGLSFRLKGVEVRNHKQRYYIQ